MLRRTTILIAIFPSLALGLLNGLYRGPVYGFGLKWVYLVDFLHWVVTPLCVWVFVLKPANISLKDVGFRIRLPGTTLSNNAIDMLVAVVVLWLAYEPVRSIAYRILWRYAPSFRFSELIPQDFPWNTIVALYFASSAALIEEGVFRGLSWAYFSGFSKRHHPRIWYVAVTSLLFGAIHLEQGPDGVIAAFSFGIAASLLYLLFRNLWPLILGHFVIDILRFWPSSG